MEELIVHVVYTESGEYKATTPLIPGFSACGLTPEEAFEKVKDRAAKWIGNKGLTTARLVFVESMASDADDKALADYGRGECLDVDDAFAKIVGMTSEDWARKVASHPEGKESS